MFFTMTSQAVATFDGDDGVHKKVTQDGGCLHVALAYAVKESAVVTAGQATITGC